MGFECEYFGFAHSGNKFRLVFVYFSMVNIEIFTKLLVFSSIRLKLASLALVLQYML